MAKTRGEEVFEEYLNGLGLKFTYEPSIGIGTRHPDYLVHASSGDVLCEVKDFQPNDDDRAEMAAALAGQDTSRSREIPYARIQSRIRVAAKQLREFKGDYPCLVVLFDSSAQVNLVDLTVLGAMYGRTMITVPIRLDGGDDDSETTIAFDRKNRYFTGKANTTVSAVAILEHVTPNQHLVDDAVSTRDFGVGSERLSEILKFIYDFSEANPHVFERVPRLHVFRNLFAVVPWPREALNGPHDLLWPTEEAGR